MKKLLIALLAFTPLSAAGQTGTAVKQSGNVTPGHPVMWSTNGVVQDAGPALLGFLTGVGVVASGQGICQNSASTGARNRVCFTASSTGAGLTMDSFGGATGPFTLALNGVTYQFPFSTSGVIGPNPTVVGHVALWNNTVGTLLADSGTISIGGTVVTLTGSLVQTGRSTYNYTPVFDLAGGILSVNELFTATAVTVPAGGKTYSDIRSSQTNGNNNTYTVGANSSVAGLFFQPEALVGSDSTSALYGGIIHCVNDGPGTCKAVHAEADAGAASTGVVVAVNAQVNPVAASAVGTSAVQIALTGGVNDVATGINFTSGAGERYVIGVGSSIGPVSIQSSFFQAWMATGSDAGARAFQVRNNAGTEIGGIDKLGGYFGPSAVFNGASSGSITVAAPAAAGSNTLTLPAATGTLVLTTYVSFVRLAVTGVNFNSGNTDTPITVTLPTGISRYQINRVAISNASASISTATIGVFTSTGGGGQTIAANQAITVTQSAADTNNNAQALAITNGGTEAYNDATLQIRVGTAQGSAATADVIITIVPLT